MKSKQKKTGGFSVAEIIMTTVVISIAFVGIANAFQGLSRTYALTRQLNEMYAVLSACPEIDRALQYDSISAGTNCFPNNVLEAEGGSGNTITYNPTSQVRTTDSLPSTDPLYAQNIPDSKVVDISVGYPNSPGIPQWDIRLLVTRNGIGQL